MQAECLSGDSRRTSMIKSEVISMINEQLRGLDTQLDDVTLSIILNLVVGEMWNCDEDTLKIHELGIARFITQRGGMQCLSRRVISEMAAM